MNNQRQRDVEALRALIREGETSGPGVPATRVFDEVRRLIAERAAPDFPDLAGRHRSER